VDGPLRALRPANVLGHLGRDNILLDGVQVTALIGADVLGKGSRLTSWCTKGIRDSC
jgi:hypothetical protein